MDVFLIAWGIAMFGLMLFLIGKWIINAEIQKSVSYILTIFFILAVYFPLVFVVFMLFEETDMLSGGCEGWCEDFAKIAGMIIGIVIPFSLFGVLQPRVYKKLKQFSKSKKKSTHN